MNDSHEHSEIRVLIADDVKIEEASGRERDSDRGGSTASPASRRRERSGRIKNKETWNKGGVYLPLSLSTL